LKSNLSSAIFTALALAPIISTPYFFQHSCIIKLDGDIQRRLPTHSWQQRVGPLALDDRFDEVLGQRLDVSSIGQPGDRS
jgi:hypothetical protein